MDVSTFEVLFKPLTPSGGNATLQAVGRRVFTGYFLTVANREDVDLTYRIELDVSLPVPDDPVRRLEGTLFIVDAGTGTGGGASLGTDNIIATFDPGDRAAGSSTYRKSFTVRARHTALVAVLPNLTAMNFFADTAPRIEVRGIVSLFLPTVLKRVPLPGRPGRDIFLPLPQLDHDARVLVQAELRSTYLPNDFVPTTPNLSSLDLDQTTTSLELAEGKSVLMLPPESFFSRALSTRSATVLNERLEDIIRMRTREPLPDEERAFEVVTALEEAASSEEALAEANRVLAEIGSSVQISRRGDDEAPAYGGRVSAAMSAKAK